MSCKSCMICLYIHLEIFIKAILSEESDSCCSIVIILMLHWFLWLRLNKECSFESDASSVITSHLHEVCDILLLKLNFCIEKSFITFTSAPEYISTSTKLNCKLDSLLNLCSSKAIYIYIICTAGTMHETRITEHICSYPKTLDVCSFCLFLQVICKLIKSSISFINVICFRYKIYIMETIILYTKFLHEFYTCINLSLCMLHCTFFSSTKSLIDCSSSKHIDTISSKIMPPCHSKRKMLLHRLSENHLLRIIILKCKWILAVRSLIFYYWDILKNLAH